MKLSEVIAEIENGSERIYEAKTCSDWKTQIKISGGYFHLDIFREGERILRSMPAGGFNGNIMTDYDWKPLPEYVTWQEALKAMSKGEKICCEVCGLEYRSVQGFLVEPVMINKGIWSVE